MKVTFFTLSMAMGGAERVIKNLAEKYAEQGHQVSIITCFKAKEEYIIASGIKRVVLEQAETQQLNKVLRFARRRKRLVRELKKVQSDVLICFLPEPCLLALSMKFNIQCPIIISERSDPNVLYGKGMFSFVVRKMYNKADGCVFQTEGARAYFDDKIQKKSCIIINPLNEAFLDDPYTGVREKEIVTVGRLYKAKNQAMMIRAFARFHEKCPEYHLTIYGEGSLREKLQQLIEQCHMTEHITLYGQTTKIYDRIHKASLFVISSNYEGMPNALLEAMAIGVPVVATDCPCGGPGSLIEDCVNGRLIPVGDESALYQVFLDMSENSEQYAEYAKKALKIREEANPTKICRLWQEYINRVMDSNANCQ